MSSTGMAPDGADEGLLIRSTSKRGRASGRRVPSGHGAPLGCMPAAGGAETGSAPVSGRACRGQAVGGTGTSRPSGEAGGGPCADSSSTPAPARSTGPKALLAGGVRLRPRHEKVLNLTALRRRCHMSRFRARLPLRSWHSAAEPVSWSRSKRSGLLSHSPGRTGTRQTIPRHRRLGPGACPSPPMPRARSCHPPERRP